MTMQVAELPERSRDQILERVLGYGDLSSLTLPERNEYLLAVCKSLSLNPLTRPIEYIELDGKLTLYIKRDATDQLRKNNEVRTSIMSRELVDGVYIVTVRAQMPNGREDESIGAVPLVKEEGEWRQAQNSNKRYFNGTGKFVPLTPSDRANAIMKAESKAKRRVTLSILGLGLMDESELDTVRGATYDVDPPRNTLPPPVPHPSQPPPPPQDIAADPPELAELKASMVQMTRDQRLKLFAEIKADLLQLMGEEVGKESYYAVLIRWQVQHSSQFQMLSKAQGCMGDLWELRRRCQMQPEAPDA